MKNCLLFKFFVCLPNANAIRTHKKALLYNKILFCDFMIKSFRDCYAIVWSFQRFLPPPESNPFSKRSEERRRENKIFFWRYFTFEYWWERSLNYLNYYFGLLIDLIIWGSSRVKEIRVDLELARVIFFRLFNFQPEFVWNSGE